jgi:cytochrome c biogenesis protein CcmG/thiol:disulfide interchange protein DsbE
MPGTQLLRCVVITPYARPTPRLRLVAVVVALAVGLSACASSGLKAFTATGPALPLPSDGALADAGRREFEGILVGLRGRAVVVNVWASWCGPCRVEAPLLQRAARRYGDDVVFLGIDSKDERAAGREFLRHYGITYPNLFDGSGAIRHALELRGFPTTYIFGRDGDLVASVVGGISEQTLAARVADARR